MAKRKTRISAETLGRRIAEKRKGLKLSQMELSQQAGISSGGISNYESGKTYPSEPVLEKLAAALGTTADELETPGTDEAAEVRDPVPIAHSSGTRSPSPVGLTTQRGGTALYPVRVPKPLADAFDGIAAARGQTGAEMLAEIMREIVQGRQTAGRIIASYTLDELAEIWGVSRRALDDYRRAGRLEAFRIGGVWYVSPDAIDDFVARGGMSGGLPRRKSDREE